MGESAREAAIFLILGFAAVVLLLKIQGDSWREIASVAGLTVAVMALVIGLAWLAETIG